jgi:vitamin B12 transporter
MVIFNLKKTLHICLSGMLLLLCNTFLFAQDTVVLKEIDVTAKKVTLSAHGKKFQVIDSITKQQFIFYNIGDLLSLNSPVFIKNYGPGSISTSAFRGGSASHTGITWNGLNIQNGMLGQSDLSLIPSSLFENISVEYGGSSSLWGSGAVAGSIHLRNKFLFNKGITTKANVGAGSFGLFNSSAGIEHSSGKFISATRFYLQSSANDFLYRDTLDRIKPVKKQLHAAYSMRGVTQDLRWRVKENNLVSVSAWYNEAVREIPLFNRQTISRPLQSDKNFKSSADWNYISGRTESNFKAAYFYDELFYDDKPYSIDSRNFLNTFIAENENIYTQSKQLSFTFGLNHTNYQAKTKNYGGTRSLQKTAASAGSKWTTSNERLSVYSVVRAEHFSAGVLPITGNISAEYTPLKNLKAKLNTARIYRQPTLNELYWIPGGNPEILPEQGYTTEGDLSWFHSKNNFEFAIGSSAYLRFIDNWILWLPSNNFSTPVNIQKVFSRGTETNTKITYRNESFFLSATCLSAYVLSTVEENRQENGNTLHRQLIYTPRYTINSNITAGIHKFSAVLYHQYMGYRFISSDNRNWLPPYHYFSARVNYKLRAGQTALILFAACNNLTNTNYRIMAGRPMPLRNFELGISLINNKSKTITKEQNQNQ